VYPAAFHGRRLGRVGPRLGSTSPIEGYGGSQMTTSERKNLRRLKRISALKVSNASEYDAARNRLLSVWTAEVWRRVARRDLCSASDIIKTAALFGLASEITSEVVKAVEHYLGGPGFRSQSVSLPRAAHPDAVASWCKRFESAPPAVANRGG